MLRISAKAKAQAEAKEKQSAQSQFLLATRSEMKSGLMRLRLIQNSQMAM